MKMVKSLLLGGAAGLVALTGAQAADLPVKAAPVQYVKICSLYGAGFYYMPGTDTCLKVGGYVRAEMNFNAGGSYNPFRVANFDSPGTDFESTRVRAGITADARTQTAFGTLRSYLAIAPTATNGGTSGTAGGTPYDPVFFNAGFIQLAGFTAGLTGSFFDFDTQPYSNGTPWWSSNQGGNGIAVFAYTAQFGNGWSATISAEDTTNRRSSVTGFGETYAGREWPDVVGNLRVDQAWGSAQIMGAVHNVHAYTVGTTVEDNATGYAVGGGLKLNAPMLGKGDFLIGQVTYSKGATNYLLVNSGAGGAAFALSTGYPVVTDTALGQVFDAVATAATGGLDLTTGWDVTVGFEHRWVPNWKTSIYGGYGELRYSDAASAVIRPAGTTGNANWSAYQVGSRTVWTVVPNLDLSLELTYNKVNGAYDGQTAGGVTYGDKGFVSGMFRVQRNFYP